MPAACQSRGVHGPGTEGTASAPACSENLALPGASASSSSGSGRTISQPMEKGHRDLLVWPQGGSECAIGRLLHKFGVGKEGTAEREVLIAKAKVATSVPLLRYSSALPLLVGHSKRRQWALRELVGWAQTSKLVGSRSKKLTFKKPKPRKANSEIPTSEMLCNGTATDTLFLLLLCHLSCKSIHLLSSKYEDY